MSTLLLSPARASLLSLLHRTVRLPTEVARDLKRTLGPTRVGALDLFTGLELTSCVALPSFALERLAAHPHAAVRASVVQHVNCPPRVLDRLMSDADAEVREAAVAARPRIQQTIHVSMAADLISSLGMKPVNSEMLLHLLRQSTVPTPLLAKLFEPGRLPGVRSYCGTLRFRELMDEVLAQPTFTPAVLARMAEHPWPRVRAEAARHRGLPGDVLVRLLGDTHHEVRREAWAHPKLPASWRQRLLRLGFREGLARKPARKSDLWHSDWVALGTSGRWLRVWAGHGPA